MAASGSCPETCSRMQFQYFEMVSTDTAIRAGIANEEDDTDCNERRGNCADNGGNGRNRTRQNQEDVVSKADKTGKVLFGSIGYEC